VQLFQCHNVFRGFLIWEISFWRRVLLDQLDLGMSPEFYPALEMGVVEPGALTPGGPSEVGEVTERHVIEHGPVTEGRIGEVGELTEIRAGEVDHGTEERTGESSTLTKGCEGEEGK
jgi:hypothetical protein